jgi:hypothetical protein
MAKKKAGCRPASIVIKIAETQQSLPTPHDLAEDEVSAFVSTVSGLLSPGLGVLWFLPA